jgi:hypothetical protein
MWNQIGKDSQNFQLFLERLQIEIKKGNTNRFGYNRGQERKNIHYSKLHPIPLCIPLNNEWKCQNPLH